jgi:CTP:phosphocholine cytidylyltransferase-like protein
MRSSFFRRIFSRLVLSSFVLAWFIAPCTTHAAACTTSTQSLYGWYGMLVSGTTTGVGPKYLAGALLFDGAGGLTARNIYVSGSTSDTATGTYVLNSDCTLTLSITIGASAAQLYTVAVTSQNEALGIEVDSSAVATIDLTAQYATYTSGLNFNNSSANGLFVGSCYGPSSSSSDLNIVTFASGSLSGSDPYNNAGSFQAANNPYSGTYTVNSDGTLSGSLIVDGTNFDYFGVISNGGAEVQYFYTNVSNGAATGAFEACVVKR